ncbi:MAG: hypothetical protein ACK4YP_06845 [Myxococcota bacterium]
MRTASFLALALPLAAGCDPCHGYEGTVVTDPLDLVGDEEVSGLQAAVDEWLGWVGPDRVCVTEVSFADEPDDGSSLILGPTWEVRVDPAASPVPAVRSSLCLALDHEEHLSEALAEVLGSDDAEQDFLNGCFQGAPAPGWEAQVAAACGTTHYTDRERFLLDEVYVNAPVGRVDGDLALTAGTPVRVPGVTYLGDLVGAGDHLALLERVREEETLRVHRVDPETGEATVPVEVDGDAGSLFGGDAAVFAVREGDGDTAHVIGADGAVTTVSVDAEVVYREGIVSEGTLYVYDGLVEGFTAVDLATGVSTEIPLPTTEAPRSITVSDLAPVEGGVVAELLDAEIEVDGDMVSIGVHGYTIARWDAASGEWTTLATDFRGSLHGRLADGRVFATLYAAAGPVFAAYDPAADMLHLSDDLCADTAYIAAVAGGRPWSGVIEGETAVFTPHTYAP